MRRRKLLGLFGGAAVPWPLAARAQPRSMPTLGFLNAGSRKSNLEEAVAAFLRGLAQAGFEDGRNVAIEYRWAEGHYDKLPALAAELVGRKVNVIAATSTPAAVAAKAATTTIPIVFTTAGDPVELGFVASLGRPGGNLTGATQLNVEVAPKRLELLHELLPQATDIGLLLNPRNPMTKTVAHDLQAAASTLGLRLHVLAAADERELAEVLSGLPQQKIEALVIGTDVFFNSQSPKLAAFALSARLPAIYQYNDFADSGGLMSLGGQLTESYRMAGIYAGRILKGEKPADLAVQQVTKVELILNLRTAKALGLKVPAALLERADRIIE